MDEDFFALRGALENIIYYSRQILREGRIMVPRDMHVLDITVFE